ncbi:MAG TPA: sigma-70 family RNA polymerase sigma factor [Vicinamibacteria bacterium]|nr:sigma-70 family RNA polymerase sigma factor [Vicinamibacteria bacterium]
MSEGSKDASDVSRVLAGDSDGFEGIVRRWQRPLVNLAWRFCRDRATSEDMAQEAFVKAFRSLRSFRGQAAFGTWLTAIALNTYRSRLRNQGAPLLSLDAARLLALAPGAARQLEDAERAEAVRRAVLALPGRYRDVIILFYFQEMDLAETARILGAAEGTVKARLYRGRELLKSRCALLAPAAARTPGPEE